MCCLAFQRSDILTETSALAMMEELWSARGDGHVLLESWRLFTNPQLISKAPHEFPPNWRCPVTLRILSESPGLGSIRVTSCLLEIHPELRRHVEATAASLPGRTLSWFPKDTTTAAP